jgi:hypothetical protein
MEENTEDLGTLNKLALITDGIDNIFLNSKAIVIFELSKEDYEKIKMELLGPVSQNTNKFSIDISGTEVVFILENSYITIEEPPKEKTFKDKLKRIFSFKRRG